MLSLGGRIRGEEEEGERRREEGRGEEKRREKEEGKRNEKGGEGHTFQSSVNPVGDLLHFVHQLVILIFGL